MKKLFHGILYFFDRLSTDRVTVHAGYTTLFIIISAFPFLMLLLSLGQIIGQSVIPFSEESLIEMMLTLFPKNTNITGLVTSVIRDLYNKTSGTLISITAITTLWSASKGIFGLLIGLNSAYHTLDRRTWIVQRMICLFYTLIFIFIILLSLILLVYGNKLQALLISLFPFLQQASWVITLLRNMVMLLVMVFFFTLVYHVFPDQHSNFLDQIPGALFASLGWIVFSYGFSIYVGYFNNYSVVYGSLSGIVLIILWLYFCISIILIGGEINSLIFEHGLIQRIKAYEPYIDSDHTKL